MPKIHPRVKNPCLHLIVIYHGDRGIATRGEWKHSKDYTFACCSKPTEPNHYSKSYGKTVEELCNGCKKYFPIKRL